MYEIVTVWKRVLHHKGSLFSATPNHTVFVCDNEAHAVMRSRPHLVVQISHTSLSHGIVLRKRTQEVPFNSSKSPLELLELLDPLGPAADEPLEHVPRTAALR
jgi:hypothetical protein